MLISLTAHTVLSNVQHLIKKIPRFCLFRHLRKIEDLKQQSYCWGYSINSHDVGEAWRTSIKQHGKRDFKNKITTTDTVIKITAVKAFQQSCCNCHYSIPAYAH